MQGGNLKPLINNQVANSILNLFMLTNNGGALIT